MSSSDPARDAAGGGPRAPDAREIVRLVARAHEPDRHLAALLAADADVCDALLAVAAFAGEVGRIAVMIGEPTIAAIRLQWWRDALALPARGARTGHPVADAIRHAADRHGLPVDRLIGYIDAQDDAIGEQAVADDAALDTLLDATEGALYALAMAIVGGPASVEEHRALIVAAGRASGIVRLLAELPALAAQRRMLLPATRLAAAGLDREAVLAGGASTALRPVLHELGRAAREQLGVARRMLALSPTRHRVAFLPLALVEPQLRLLEKPSREPMRDVIDLLPLSRVVRVGLAHWLGRP